ncbi:MAG: phosphotransferase [Thermomicrobiales bacterium]
MTPDWQTIRRAIPELHDLPETEPPRIDSGQNAIAWDAAPFIVRVPRHDTAAGALHREASILHEIGPFLPLPTPEIALHTLPDGMFVAIHRALPGQPLLTPPEDRIDSLADALGGFLQDLHAIPHAALDGIALPVANRGSWRVWLRDAAAQLAPYLDRADLQRLMDAGEAFRDALATVTPVLIHGDFGKGNILAEDGRITGIIDFGSAQIGDPASDLAGLVSSYGAAFLDHMEDAYPGATAPAIRTRITFYRLAFAAMDARYGLDHDDRAAFDAGIASLSQRGPDASTDRQT